ncbi:MAG: AraC family transcriptional regulator [Saprospiraceae bacterium]|nr:AraC family transcriptional regulator [Saprospiraceae bacterium]MCB9306593.1 AraC family transcriptional regulator [Lewinellaceae bacterium]MCB9355267.1 AraC family transcriptional regulator [Lewinellaceae bacterium]
MEKIPVRQIKHPEFSGSFNIREIGPLVSGQDMIQKTHRHTFFFVLALEKGEGEHVIDFTTYPVSDHSVFIMRPGQVHQLTLKQGSIGYLMEFDNDFYSPHEKPASQVLRKASGKNHCPLNADKFRKIHALLSFIFEEYTDKKEKYKEVIRANLEILFIALVRQSQSPGDHSKNAGNAQERLEELLQLLDTHISTKKQVAEYAKLLHLTPYRLNAITKELLGKNCSELINDQIILEAKRYLLATSNQVNQIAGQLGYDDVSYFIRFFKKHTGYSPELFRQHFR